MIDNKIFNINSIFIDTDIKSKEELFEIASNYFVSNKYGDDFEKIKKGFYDREEEGSTAFVDGIGIPHSKVDSIKNPGIIIIKNNCGIEWDSLDDKPTFLFICLAIPNDNTSTIHLKMLSSIARKLVDNEFKSNLLKSKSSSEIFELISSVEIV